VDFLKQSICEGQSEVGPIGYSPLPVNLVQAGFTQINKLKLADSKVDFDASIIKDVKNCHNPTFIPGKPGENYLAKIAPFPADCDRPGKGPCAEGVGVFNENPDDDGKVPQDAGGAQGGTSDGGAGGNGATGKGKANGAGAGTTSAAGAGATDTDGDGVPDAAPGGGDPAAVDDLGLGTTTAEGGDAAPVVATTLNSDGSSGPPGALTALVVGLFVATLVVPTIVSQTVARRRGGR